MGCQSNVSAGSHWKWQYFQLHSLLLNMSLTIASICLICSFMQHDFVSVLNVSFTLCCLSANLYLFLFFTSVVGAFNIIRKMPSVIKKHAITKCALVVLRVVFFPLHAALVYFWNLYKLIRIFCKRWRKCKEK